MNKNSLIKRIFMSLFGVIICAISVGIFKIAALGVDPSLPIRIACLIIGVVIICFGSAFYHCARPLLNKITEK